MINTNQIQVNELFNDPLNQDRLLVYEVKDYDNNNQAILLENTNNTVKLNYVGNLFGALISTTIGPQVKIIDELTNSIGLKITTDYVFITNNDCSFLEQTNKTYFFTVNKVINKDVPVYFIGENSIKSFSNIDDEQIKLDQKNLTNLWSISIQSFDKLAISKNSKVNFELLTNSLPVPNDDLYANYISYGLNMNTLFQNIQVHGDLYNIVTKEVKKDVQFNLINKYRGRDINDPETNYFDGSFLPLFVSFQNLQKKSVIFIKNFDSSFQLIYVIAEIIVQWYHDPKPNENLLEFIFKKYTTPELAKELKQLFDNICSLSWAFNNNFNLYFDKKDQEFIDYFSITYSNVEPLQYITNLINTFISKYPNLPNQVVWNIFQSLCMSCSDVLISPYSWGGGGSQIHKKVLWYYCKLKIQGSKIEDFGFDKSGRLTNNQKLLLEFDLDSVFFDIELDKKQNPSVLYLKQKTPFYFNKIQNQWYENRLINYPYLPDKITEIGVETDVVDYPTNNDALKYLVYKHFNTQYALQIFLKSTSGEKFTEKTTITVPERFLSEDITIEQYISRYAPANSRILNIIRSKKEKTKVIETWDICGTDANAPYMGSASNEDGGCYKYTELDDGPDENNKRWCKKVWYEGVNIFDFIGWCKWDKPRKELVFERKAKAYVDGFKYSATAEIETDIVGNIQTMFTEYELNEFFLKHQNTFNKYTHISMSLADDEFDNNWRILNVKQDTFYSIFNTSPYLDIARKNWQYVRTIYRKESFQNLDNTITKTTTHY